MLKKILNIFKRPPERLVGFTTSDLYLASYLIIEGAEIENVSLKSRRIRKDYYERRYSIRLRDVKASAITNWKKRKAVGNLNDFSKARQHLKKECNNILH